MTRCRGAGTRFREGRRGRRAGGAREAEGREGLEGQEGQREVGEGERGWKVAKEQERLEAWNTGQVK
jgi:hypothetical protein